MIELPRNDVPCNERRCQLNCNHVYNEHCVVPDGDNQKTPVKYNDPCHHTDESYENGMKLLEDIGQGNNSPDDLIRQNYAIPHDQPITEIDRRNFEADAMAEAHAVFNMRPPATLC